MTETAQTRTRRKPVSTARFRLSLRSNTPLYEQVKESIRQQIASGVLRPGDRVPPLRQLSADLKIAYATIGRAIRSLVEEGVLEAKTARGTIVAERRSARHGAIGLLGYKPFQSVLRETHYYKTVLYLLQEAFVAKGQTVVYGHQSVDRPLAELFDNMRTVDGVVLLGLDQARWAELGALGHLRLPTVVVSQTLESDMLPCVDSDNEHDAYRTVRAMQKMGHRSIAFVELVEERGRTAHRFRSAGYRRAMDDAGLPPGRDWYVIDHPDSWAERLLALRPRPTAILLDGVSEFERLFQGLQGTELEPGKGLLVAAYDENLWGKIAAHGIEHIRIDQPLERIANATADMLLAMLKNARYRPHATLLPSTILHVRDDGAVKRLAADDAGESPSKG